MFQKFFGSLLTAGALALVPGGAALAQVDDEEDMNQQAEDGSMTSAHAADESYEYDSYYGAYEGGYEAGFDDDDWFYDYYSYGGEADFGGDEWASYDLDADVFDWEEDGLFA